MTVLLALVSAGYAWAAGVLAINAPAQTYKPGPFVHVKWTYDLSYPGDGKERFGDGYELYLDGRLVRSNGVGCFDNPNIPVMDCHPRVFSTYPTTDTVNRWESVYLTGLENMVSGSWHSFVVKEYVRVYTPGHYTSYTPEFLQRTKRFCYDPRSVVLLTDSPVLWHVSASTDEWTELSGDTLSGVTVNYLSFLIGAWTNAQTYYWYTGTAGLASNQKNFDATPLTNPLWLPNDTDPFTHHTLLTVTDRGPDEEYINPRSIQTDVYLGVHHRFENYVVMNGVPDLNGVRHGVMSRQKIRDIPGAQVYGGPNGAAPGSMSFTIQMPSWSCSVQIGGMSIWDIPLSFGMNYTFPSWSRTYANPVYIPPGYFSKAQEWEYSQIQNGKCIEYASSGVINAQKDFQWKAAPPYGMEPRQVEWSNPVKVYTY